MSIISPVFNRWLFQATTSQNEETPFQAYQALKNSTSLKDLSFDTTKVHIKKLADLTTHVERECYSCYGSLWNIFRAVSNFFGFGECNKIKQDLVHHVKALSLYLFAEHDFKPTCMQDLSSLDAFVPAAATLCQDLPSKVKQWLSWYYEPPRFCLEYSKYFDADDGWYFVLGRHYPEKLLTLAPHIPDYELFKDFNHGEGVPCVDPDQYPRFSKNQVMTYFSSISATQLKRHLEINFYNPNYLKNDENTHASANRLYSWGFFQLTARDWDQLINQRAGDAKESLKIIKAACLCDTLNLAHLNLRLYTYKRLKPRLGDKTRSEIMAEHSTLARKIRASKSHLYTYNITISVPEPKGKYLPKHLTFNEMIKWLNDHQGLLSPNSITTYSKHI